MPVPQLAREDSPPEMRCVQIAAGLIYFAIICVFGPVVRQKTPVKSDKIVGRQNTQKDHRTGFDHKITKTEGKVCLNTRIQR